MSAEVITPVFKEIKNGKVRIISIFAKKARGMMVRHLIDQDASSIEDIKSFTTAGYAYSEAETLDALNPVFIR